MTISTFIEISIPTPPPIQTHCTKCADVAQALNRLTREKISSLFADVYFLLATRGCSRLILKTITDSEKTFDKNVSRGVFAYLKCKCYTQTQSDIGLDVLIATVSRLWELKFFSYSDNHAQKVQGVNFFFHHFLCKARVIEKYSQTQIFVNLKHYYDGILNRVNLDPAEEQRLKEIVDYGLKNKSGCKALFNLPNENWLEIKKCFECKESSVVLERLNPSTINDLLAKLYKSFAFGALQKTRSNYFLKDNFSLDQQYIERVVRFLHCSCYTSTECKAGFAGLISTINRIKDLDVFTRDAPIALGVQKIRHLFHHFLSKQGVIKKYSPVQIFANLNDFFEDIVRECDLDIDKQQKLKQIIEHGQNMYVTGPSQRFYFVDEGMGEIVEHNQRTPTLEETNALLLEDETQDLPPFQLGKREMSARPLPEAKKQILGDDNECIQLI